MKIKNIEINFLLENKEDIKYLKSDAIDELREIYSDAYNEYIDVLVSNEVSTIEEVLSQVGFDVEVKHNFKPCYQAGAYIDGVWRSGVAPEKARKILEKHEVNVRLKKAIIELLKTTKKGKSICASTVIDEHSICSYSEAVDWEIEGEEDFLFEKVKTLLMNIVEEIDLEIKRLFYELNTDNDIFVKFLIDEDIEINEKFVKKTKCLIKKLTENKEYR